MNEEKIIEQFLTFLENASEYSGSDSLFNVIDEHTIEVTKPSDEMQRFFIWMNKDTLPQA